MNPIVRRGKNRTIAFRMLALMIIFLFIVFAAIFISFNLSVGEYVKRETNDQIAKALNDVQGITFSLGTGVFRAIELTKEEMQQLARTPLFYNQLYQGVVQSLKTSNTDSEVNIALYDNTQYQRFYPDEQYNLFQDLNEIDVLINNIKINNFTVSNKAYRTSTSYGNYYLTLVDLNELYGLSGLSVAIYINTAKYDALVGTINMTLLVILIIATVLSFVYVVFISRNITKPIQDLCHFADEIGRGKFERIEYRFRDREFIDLNNRMNETAGKLEKNDEDQKVFFQNVSHELKTPLMSIRGYAEGIKYGVFSDEHQREEASDIIMSETERLNDLVSDLLYISKLDSFKKIDKENKMVVNLSGLVKDCAEKLRGLLVNTNKRINMCEPSCEVYIECDESSLIRAILNVMANCVQYSESKVDVSVYTETEPVTGSESIVLSIRDDGDGIAENDLPNIFKRFYKGSKGKHGIGLSITKAIVEQHDGVISARNTDKGAEFLLKFKGYTENT